MSRFEANGDGPTPWEQREAEERMSMAQAILDTIAEQLAADLPEQIAVHFGRHFDRIEARVNSRLSDMAALLDRFVKEVRTDFADRLHTREQLYRRELGELAARVSGLQDLLHSLRLTSDQPAIINIPEQPAPRITVSVPPLGTRTKHIAYDDLGRPISIMETDTSDMELDPDLDLPEDISDEHE